MPNKKSKIKVKAKPKAKPVAKVKAKTHTKVKVQTKVKHKLETKQKGTHAPTKVVHAPVKATHTPAKAVHAPAKTVHAPVKTSHHAHSTHHAHSSHHAPAKVVSAPVQLKEKPKAKVEIPFQMGEFAVYPAHGVGKIEAVETKTIMGEKMEFLVISILDTGMNVLVPVSNIANVGLRPVIKQAKVKEVYDVLKQKKRSVIGSTWNRRYREYMEKIKSGSVFEIAEVLRDLIVLKGDKDLSFGERKMLDTAKSLLIKELALAKGVNEKKIELEIQKIFNPEA